MGEAEGMVVAVSQGAALLLLFVVLPLVLAAAIAWLVQSRSEPFPPELRTSNLLRDGDPAEATLLDWRSPSQSFLDRHPMITFRVAVGAGVPFELDITQSIPRALLRSLEKGDIVDVRLSADRTAGAIVLSAPNE